MCLHKWKEYIEFNEDDEDENKYYRICEKCGLAQEGKKYVNLHDIEHDTFHMVYKTDSSLCKTNNWKSVDFLYLKGECNE